MALRHKFISVALVTLLAGLTGYHISHRSDIPEFRRLTEANSPAKFSDFYISFVFNVDADHDLWVGDILKIYDDAGKLLATLRQPATVQGATYVSPSTLTFDLTSSAFTDKPIKREDLVDLGKPLGSATTVTWHDGVLKASGASASACLTAPNGAWQSCANVYRDTLPGMESIRQWIARQTDAYQLLPIAQRHAVAVDYRNNAVSTCSVAADSAVSCTPPTPFQCSYVSTYHVSDNAAYIYCGDGNVQRYDLQTAALETLVSAKQLGISNQFSSSYLASDATLLGHFPSGALMKLPVGQRFFSSASAPLVRSGFSGSGRGVHSMASIGGKMLVGAWPWGELWDLVPGPLAESYSSATEPVTLFDDTLRTDEAGQLKRRSFPYENALPKSLPPTTLGQRISSMTPCWHGLCLSTANTSNTNLEAGVAPANTLAQYGRVYYLPAPSVSCTADITGTHHYELSVTPVEATLKVDGVAECTFPFAQPGDHFSLLNHAARIDIGSAEGSKNGHSGQLHVFIRS